MAPLVQDRRRLGWAQSGDPLMIVGVKPLRWVGMTGFSPAIADASGGKCSYT